MSRLVAARMSEAELMEHIRVLCKDLRLHAFHVKDSRGCWGPGFPDLVIAGPGGCIFRECKTEVGSLSAEQQGWAYILQAAGMRCSVWRPRDLLSGTISKELGGIAGTAEMF